MPDATYYDASLDKLCIDTTELIGLLVRSVQQLETRLTRMEAKQALAELNDGTNDSRRSPEATPESTGKSGEALKELILRGGEIPLSYANKMTKPKAFRGHL